MKIIHYEFKNVIEISCRFFVKNIYNCYIYNRTSKNIFHIYIYLYSVNYVIIVYRSTI